MERMSDRSRLCLCPAVHGGDFGRVPRCLHTVAHGFSMFMRTRGVRDGCSHTRCCDVRVRCSLTMRALGSRRVCSRSFT